MALIQFTAYKLLNISKENQLIGCEEKIMHSTTINSYSTFQVRWKAITPNNSYNINLPPLFATPILSVYSVIHK